eukprot:6361240-Prymnesium_polylepis.1
MVEPPPTYVVSHDDGARNFIVTTPFTEATDFIESVSSSFTETAADGLDGCWKLSSYAPTVDEATSPTTALDGRGSTMKPECETATPTHGTAFCTTSSTAT